MNPSVATWNGRLRLGTAGWAYDDWRGNFYPDKLATTKRLAYYATQFNTVEVDSTFYAIPRPSNYDKWAEQVPDGFLFSLKVPQVITHEKSLRDCQPELTAFLDGASRLGDKLGPILFQFPYGFKPDRLSDLLDFLDNLPKSGFKFVVEIRNKAWYKSKLPDELERREFALALVDHPWLKPVYRRVTGKFIYARWLGDQDWQPLYSHVQLDKRSDLQAWAEELANRLNDDTPVYGYFNNHFDGHGPSDVLAMSEFLTSLMSGTKPNK